MNCFGLDLYRRCEQCDLQQQQQLLLLFVAAMTPPPPPPPSPPIKTTNNRFYSDTICFWFGLSDHLATQLDSTYIASFVICLRAMEKDQFWRPKIDPSRETIALHYYFNLKSVFNVALLMFRFIVLIIMYFVHMKPVQQTHIRQMPQFDTNFYLFTLTVRS